MTTRQILLLWAALLVVMLACRCLPLLLLGDRRLPERVERAIGLIPVAAFTALVANDLVQPDSMATDPLGSLVLAVSSAVVLVVARKTGSLVWCAIVGMGVYAALGMFVGTVG